MQNQDVFPWEDVLGENVIVRNGSFQRVELFLSGKRTGLGKFGNVSFVTGLSGEETRVVRDIITPKGVMEIK